MVGVGPKKISKKNRTVPFKFEDNVIGKLLYKG
jgi:hypothetical protein